MAKKIKKEGKLIGRVTHYFSNIEVAVIKLTAPLKKGDKIRIIGGQETDFDQKVGSMQVEHKEVKLAKKGVDVGLKVDEVVRDGYKVYKK
jgi:putative protease